MTLKIGIHANKIDTLDPRIESTFLIGAEAQARGYEVFHFTTENLFMEDCVPKARVKPLHHVTEPVRAYDVGDERLMDLGAEPDVILLRQNPALGKTLNNIHTHILERVMDRVLVLNNPVSLRTQHWKIFPTEFPEYVAPYMFCHAVDPALEFIKKHGTVVIKPMYGYGGHGILRLQAGESNLKTVLHLHMAAHPGTMIVQKYIPEAEKGDKRITFFDGEPVCALMRTPADGGWLSNITQGGGYQTTELTDHEQEICAKFGPRFRDLGLFFVGLDVIGDYVTEIGYTSPGMLHWSNEAYGKRYEKLFWDRLDDKIAQFQSTKAA